MIKNGFTLMEILVVVAIIGILSMIAYPAYDNYIMRAALTEYQAQMISKIRRIEQEFIANGDSFSMVETAASILCNDQPIKTKNTKAETEYTCRQGKLTIDSNILRGNRIGIIQNYEEINISGQKWVDYYHIGLRMMPNGQTSIWGYGIINTRNKKIKRIYSNYVWGDEGKSYQLLSTDGTLKRMNASDIICYMRLPDKNNMPVPKNMRPSNCKYFHYSPNSLGYRILTI